MENPENVFTRLLLIRHGQTDWNKEKLIQGSKAHVPLNTLGMQQAAAISNHIKRDFQVEVLYTSSAIRTQQTAQQIANAFSIDMKISSDLSEVDFGDFSGANILEIEEIFPAYFTAFRHFVKTNRSEGTSRPTIPNGETIEHIESRVIAFVSEILTNHQGKHIAAVSHGSLIKCLLTYFSGASMHDYMPYWVENASISVIDFYGSVPIIRRLNDISHLQNRRLDFAISRII